VEPCVLEDPDGLRELEVVQVAEDDHVRRRVCSVDLRDEVRDQVRLLVPLGRRDLRGRLEAAAERVVAPLRVEVVGNHEQLMAAVGELGRQRLARRVPAFVAGSDATRAI
jgi:hypothetical protein